MENQDRITNLMEWKYRVEGKDFLAMPDGYQDQREHGTYKRFMGFVQEFAEKLLFGVGTGLKYMTKEEAFFQELDYDHSALPKQWWSIAKQVGNGKKTAETIPTITSPDKQNNLTVYNAILPAYRAIKESFEKRSFWQWFTNHAEYTAERDAMKSLEGLMLSLTGDTKAQLEEAYAEYKSEIEFETDPSKEIKASVKEKREKFKARQKSAEAQKVTEEQKKEFDSSKELYEDMNESVVSDADDDALYEEDDDRERTSITVDLEKGAPKQTLSEKMDAIRKEQIKKNLGL